MDSTCKVESDKGRDQVVYSQAPAADEAAALTDMPNTTSLSTQGNESNESAASSTAVNPAFRSFRATRQTMEELEFQTKKQVVGCSSSCDCLATKPGAVAVATVGDTTRDSVEMAASTTTTLPCHGIVDSNRTGASRSVIVKGEQDDDDDCQVHATASALVDEIPMIHAQLAEDPPFAVQAELVVPPPLAFNVRFDEEAAVDTTAPAEDGPRQPPNPPAGSSLLPLVNYSVCTKEKLLSKRNFVWLFRFQVFLLVLGLILALVIPKSKEKDSVEGVLGDDYLYQHPLSEELSDELPEAALVIAAAAAPVSDFWIFDPTPSSAPTPQPSVIAVHPCYTTTWEIAMAQLEHPSQDLFILCPNVLHKIGTYNDDNTAIVHGEYPLMALLDNIEIRCWLDGGRDNKCVLDGGFLQVSLDPTGFPNETLAHAFDSTGTLDNVIFRGITFTGVLNTTTDSSVVSGTSVYLNHPGRNITFIDCAWENMVAPRGVAQIGDSNMALVGGNNVSLKEPTMGVTFVNCTFLDIEYGGEGTPLISVYGQEATIRQSRFRNLTLSDPLVSCMLGGDTMEWCQGILYCMNHSRCELQDICIDGLEYAGLAAIAATSHDADLVVSGPIHVEDMMSPEDLTFLNCSSGLASFSDDENQAPDCWGRDVSFSDANIWSDFCT